MVVEVMISRIQQVVRQNALRLPGMHLTGFMNSFWQNGRLPAWILFGFIVLAGCLSTTNARHSAIDSLFHEYDHMDAPGCAVAVYENRERQLSRAYGIANLDYGIPLSDSSRFHMASLSRQLTAAAVGVQIVRGEIDPVDPVSDYLENWPEWAADVRIRHLLYHTSGLPDLFSLMKVAGISINDVLTLEDYVALIQNGAPLRFDPGSRRKRSSADYTLLARIVEVSSNTSFSDFVAEEVLEPLGMTETHFHDDRYRNIPNRVISYEPASPNEATPAQTRSDTGYVEDDGRKPVPPYRQIYPGNFQGVGHLGLYSSIRDWRHWEDYLNGTDFSLEMDSVRSLLTKEVEVVDGRLVQPLGMEVASWQGMDRSGESDHFYGFQVDMRRYPEHGLATLVLCNRADADPAEKSRSLARMFLKEHLEAYLAPYAGLYYNDELDVVYELLVEDGALVLDRRLSPRGIMTEEKPNIWSAGSWEFLFQRDEQSEEVEGFLISTGRVREVKFIKK